jgi:hypothetical protein
MCCTVVGPSLNSYSVNILTIPVRNLGHLHFDCIDYLVFMMQEIALFYFVAERFRCYRGCIISMPL